MRQVLDQQSANLFLQFRAGDARQQARRKSPALGQSAFLQPVPQRHGALLLQRAIPFALLLEGGMQRVLQADAFHFELFCKLRLRLRLFTLPVGHAVFVLLLEGLGRRLHHPRVGQRLFNRGLALSDRVCHRFVQKPLQNPHQDQKVDDLESEGCPVEFHELSLSGGRLRDRVAARCHCLRRYSSSGFLNKMIITTTNT